MCTLDSCSKSFTLYLLFQKKGHYYIANVCLPNSEDFQGNSSTQHFYIYFLLTTFFHYKLMKIR